MKTLKIAFAALPLALALAGCSQEKPVATAGPAPAPKAAPAAAGKGGPAVGGMGIADAQVNPDLKNPDANIGSKSGG
jgi:hypothetical protein